MRVILLLALLLSVAFSYKFLVYSPFVGHSHVNFLGKIADTLVEAGHDVTLLMPIVDELLINKTGSTLVKKVLIVDQDERQAKLMEDGRNGVMKDLWTMQPDAGSLIAISKNQSMACRYVCEKLFAQTDLIESLRSEHFDVGIAEPFTLCGFGLFEYLNIPGSIGALSMTQLDILSYYIGEPLAPSYVPSMTSTAGEKQSFFERMGNGIGTVIGTWFIRPTHTAEGEVLKELLGEKYTTPEDLISRNSFIFTNANPLLNYPRPLLAKTIEVGGVTIQKEKVAALDEKWDSILNERKFTVYISFGSAVKSKDMPEEWKKSLLAMFATLPEVTFIWKYEVETSMADHLPNVYLSPWLPQNDLLADPRLSLFITHGGLGSTTEVAHLGKPAVMVPLFGDQPRNAAMLARHGGVLTLEKNELGSPEAVRSAILKVLEDASFLTNATRLSNMLNKQPISAQQLVVSHCEFVAEFGRLPMLDAYGRNLSIIEYYLLDVIAVVLFFLLALLFFIPCVSYKIIRCIFSQKSEKKKQQ